MTCYIAAPARIFEEDDPLLDVPPPLYHISPRGTLAPPSDTACGIVEYHWRHMSAMGFPPPKDMPVCRECVRIYGEQAEREGEVLP